MVSPIQSCARIIEEQTGSGRHIEVTDEKIVQRVRELIEVDPRVTYEDIKDFLKIYASHCITFCTSIFELKGFMPLSSSSVFLQKKTPSE